MLKADPALAWCGKQTTGAGAGLGPPYDVRHQSRYAELVARVKPEDRATPEGIRACDDTTLAIVEGLGPKVIHFHVHDIDPATWKERLPIGTGFVDCPWRSAADAEGASREQQAAARGVAARLAPVSGSIPAARVAACRGKRIGGSRMAPAVEKRRSRGL